MRIRVRFTERARQIARVKWTEIEKEKNTHKQNMITSEKEYPQKKSKRKDKDRLTIKEQNTKDRGRE